MAIKTVNKNAKVSVIIPCFNQGQYIDDSVGSVLNQTFQDFEIIIVNDGSTNEFTINKLKNYNIPKCQIIHTKNHGLSAARNIGIIKSSGTYILPLDADDKIGPRYLEAASEILDRKTEIGIVYCNAEFFGNKTGLWNLPDYSDEKILMENIIFCTAMFRKSDYLETSGYNPNMIYGNEDWDFWLSLIEKGKEVYKLPDIHFYYRIKDLSMLTGMAKSLERQQYSLKMIYFNHYDLYIKKIGSPFELYSKLKKVLESKDYKVGRLIVNPVRKLNKIIKRTF